MDASGYTSSLEFYRKDKQATLSVFSRLGPAGSRVMMTLQRDPALERRLRFEGGSGPVSTLPALTPPADSTVSSTGSGSAGNSQENSAQIRSPLNMTALLEHYAAQLRRAGWKEVGRTVQKSSLTTVWSTPANLKEPAGTGILGLRENGRGQYSALLASIGFR